MVKPDELPDVSEERHQQTIFEWAFNMRRRYMLIPKYDVSEMDLLHAIPNGGKRSPIEASRWTRQGVKRGVPDLCLPTPHGGWSSLRIELKKRDGKMRAEQKWWWCVGRALQQERVVVCYGSKEAISVIERYVQLPWTEGMEPPSQEALERLLDTMKFKAEWNPRHPKRTKRRR